jgi:hypothetical protein
MIRDAELLERLAEYPTERFEGSVYRATRHGLNPLASSQWGGRWMPRDMASVLYTSMQYDGALAELCFHWSQASPPPTKSALIHTLRVKAPRTLRLVRVDLVKLRVPEVEFSRINHPRMQQIGAAVEFLGCDGLIAPSVRWACDNLILFPESAQFRGELEVMQSEEVNWQAWARDKGL